MSAADLPARERILAAAHDLFYRNGIRASGVDAIIAASGVAKLTFYRHFPAKDALVSAYLELRHERWMAWFEGALARHGTRRIRSDGRALLVLADVLQEWTADPVFRGCAFINVVAELGGGQPEVIALAQRHKRDVEAVIAGLLPAGRRRAALTQAAALAFDGAIVRAQRDADAAGGTAAASLRMVLKALLAQ